MAEREYEWRGSPGGDARVLVESDDLLVARVEDPPKFVSRMQTDEGRDALRGWSIPFAGLNEKVVLIAADRDAPPDRIDAQALAKYLQATGTARSFQRGLRFATTRSEVLVSSRIHVRFETGMTRKVVGAAFASVVEEGFDVHAERVYSSRLPAYDLHTSAESDAESFHIAKILENAPGVVQSYPHLGFAQRHTAATEEDWTLRSVQEKTGSASWRITEGHASVVAAWSLTRGSRRIKLLFSPFWMTMTKPLSIRRRIRVAVIDDGVDIDHPELAGVNKVQKPGNYLCGDTGDPRPQAPGESHGTTMAGLAVGNGIGGASGTAPAAALIPIRIMGECGSLSATVWTYNIRKAFEHAFDAKADVISCSWYADDITTDISDAIQKAADGGRGGKGCVILFSAGDEGTPTVEDNKYASRDDVIAVGACRSDRTPTHTTPPGDALWCLFPASHGAGPAGDHPVNHSVTLDQSGDAGAVTAAEASLGVPWSASPAEDYIQSGEGGTSHACAAAAGVAALVLARNHTLTRQEVKDLLAETCDRVDQANAGYDATGWSDTHGHGRIHALRAVMAAKGWGSAP